MFSVRMMYLCALLSCLHQSTSGFDNGPMSIAKPRSGATVRIALLQLPSSTPMTSRKQLADKTLAELKANGGADVAIFPEMWLPENDKGFQNSVYSTLATQYNIAVVGTYVNGNNSSALLVDQKGIVLLRHSKPKGTLTHPTASLDPIVGTFQLQSGEHVTVGILLGTDYLFMEPTRLLMIQGVQLVFQPLSEPLGQAGPRHLFWRSRENSIDIAAANYAENGASLGFPMCQTTGYHCFFSAAQGATPTHEALQDPCMILKSGTQTAVYNTSPFDNTPEAQAFANPEPSRKPFDYQPLCYADEAARVKVFNPETTSETSQNLKVTVALLQLVAAVDAVDPLTASAAKAEKYIRIAKAKGADVALLPEQWSVGYMVNAKLDNYFDRDSTEFAYASYMRWATPRSGPYVKRFQNLAIELNIAIALPFVEQVKTETGAPIPPKNTVVLIDRFGKIVYSFSKVHIAWGGGLSADVEGLNSAGREFPTGILDVEGQGNVSVCSFICYDREHPESARSCLASGAELILLPTACGVDWAAVDLVAVRASTNAVAIAMANFATAANHTWTKNGRGGAGTYFCGGLDCNGLSCGVDHVGNNVVTAPGDPEGLHAGTEDVYLAPFDIGALRDYRKTARGAALTKLVLQPQLCRIPTTFSHALPECDAHRMWL